MPRQRHRVSARESPPPGQGRLRDIPEIDKLRCDAAEPDPGRPGQPALRPGRRLPRHQPARDRPGAGCLGGTDPAPRPGLRRAGRAARHGPLLHRRPLPHRVLLRPGRAGRRRLAHGAPLRPDPGRPRLQLLPGLRAQGPHGARGGLPRLRPPLPRRHHQVLPGARRASSCARWPRPSRRSRASSSTWSCPTCPACGPGSRAAAGCWTWAAAAAGRWCSSPSGSVGSAASGSTSSPTRSSWPGG